MKKAIISLLLLAAGCSEATAPGDQAETIITNGHRVVFVTPTITGCDFEGHHYIVAYSSEGCCIIHAPNCPCQKED